MGALRSLEVEVALGSYGMLERRIATAASQNLIPNTGRSMLSYG